METSVKVFGTAAFPASRNRPVYTVNVGDNGADDGNRLLHESQ